MTDRPDDDRVYDEIRNGDRPPPPGWPGLVGVPTTPRAAALSIRQPWAWLILHAGKDIENRDWPTKRRGRFLIHAAKGMTAQEYDNALDVVGWLPEPEELLRGGIVGSAEIVDCVTVSNSPWFFGRYGFVLRNPTPLPFRPLKGQLGFFEAQL